MTCLKLLNYGFDIISSLPLLINFILQSQVDSIEEEKNESQKRYKHLEGNYKEISEELKAFGREMANAPDKSGQGQAELQLAQAKKDVEKLKAEVENLQIKCNDYQAKAHQPPQDVQRLETQLEELKNQNIELQRKRFEYEDKDPNIWRRWVHKYNADDTTIEPMFLTKTEYNQLIHGLGSFVYVYLDLNQKPKMELNIQQKPRDKFLSSAFDAKSNPWERHQYVHMAVFQFLCDEILFQPAFGLDSEDEGGKMEAGLIAFEKKIQDASAGDGHIESNVKAVLANDFADDIFKNLDCHNWKTLTYRCGKLIRKNYPEARIVAFASALEDFLKPLSKKDNGKSIEKRLLGICRQTFMLSQKLRAEPLEDYKIYFPEPGDLVVMPRKGDINEPKTEFWGAEGGHPACDSGTVAYTCFGGLFFKDKHKEEWHPLVPAKVIVKN